MAEVWNWQTRWHATRERLRYRLMPPIANWLADLATYSARQTLRSAGPISVLVDNTVLGNAITHETAWVPTGTILWGGKHPTETGYAARVPVHPVDSDRPEYAHIKHLTGIAHLARQGHLRLHTSAELKDETFRQPVGRYKGYGYFDYSLFHGIPIESIDGWVAPTTGPKWMALPSAADQQRERLTRSGDELYRSLVDALGQKNSQDAWHIRTAEEHGFHCFLTMDFKLRRRVEQLALKEPFASLRTKVLTPEELGVELGLVPLAPHLFSYTNANSFVRTDLSMPDGKRRPRSAYRQPETPPQS